MRLADDIYDSAQRHHPLVEELVMLIKYRDLVYQFVTSSIKTRYKRSFLGVIWTLLNPLLTMIVLTIVFSQLWGASTPSYPVYILSGLIAWNLFSSATNEAMGSMITKSGLLSRVYVPKSVFAVSAVGTGLVNLGLSFIPLVVIALALGVRINLSILVIPFAVLLIALFALGIGLILATAAVYFADMLPVYGVIQTIWMYATPIIYPTSILPPTWHKIFQLNPMYHLVQVFRQPIYEGTIPGATTWIIAGCAAIFTFLIGGFIFTAKSHEYAYRT